MPEEIALFVDRDFPANAKSIGEVHFLENEADLKWLRPKDIIAGACLHVEGASRDDIQQGFLADCWFLSACAALTMQPKLLQKVIPHKDALCGPSYNGQLTFNFWRYGTWCSVQIDDYLPVDANRQLVFARSTQPREFWVSLLEKAYAKLLGSYSCLEGGNTATGLVDLTSGVSDLFEIRSPHPYLYQDLCKVFGMGAFLTCAKRGNWRVDNNVLEKNGLVSGHAYTISDIRQITYRNGKEKLLRIRNPMAGSIEWKGSWSDRDTNWTWLDQKSLDSLGHKVKDDGEFWMSFKDFCHHFQCVTICIIPQEGEVFSKDIAGSWVVPKDLCPQYFLKILDGAQSSSRCRVLISLLQKNDKQPYQIGLNVYATSRPITSDNQSQAILAVSSSSPIDIRQVSCSFDLDPNLTYLVLPISLQPCDFLLRTVSLRPLDLSMVNLN